MRKTKKGVWVAKRTHGGVKITSPTGVVGTIRSDQRHMTSHLMNYLLATIKYDECSHGTYIDYCSRCAADELMDNNIIGFRP